ncbi:hypothetical protein ACWGJ9_11940 [Curtobacterium citreum]
MSGQPHRGPVQSTRRSTPGEQTDVDQPSKRGVGFYIRNLVICALTVVAVIAAPTALRAATDIISDAANCQSADCFILIP